MKTLLAALFSLAFFQTQAQSDSFFEDMHRFLQSNVKAGLIDYEQIKENPNLMNSLTQQVADYLIAGKSPQEQKAFYTNAYNILVISQVVNNLPIKGPWDVDGFFDANVFEVAGRMVTLDELEKDILFSAFPDPRLHFVLVCAAIGCPPIADYVYAPDSLESTLDQKTTEVLNIDWYVRVYKNKTSVSKVFDWYRKDFVSDSTDVKDYINQYREILIPEAHSMDIYDYNWELNDSKSRFRY